jgi:23S rRNA (uridine2552-2'-O)-methyltransferase
VGRRRRGKNSYAKPDRYTKAAKDAGYAARSVFKLTEIQRRFRVLRAGDRVLDLGCSPGSWSRYAQEVVGGRGRVVGIDWELPSDPVGEVIVADVFDCTPDEIRTVLGGMADVVMSDMAPRTTGISLGDHVRQIELATRAVDLARELLRPGGHLLTKVFDGEEAHGFVQSVRSQFERVRRIRPEAVRKESREFFLLCMGFQPDEAYEDAPSNP